MAEVVEEAGNAGAPQGVDLAPQERSASAALIGVFRRACVPYPRLARISASMTRASLGEDTVRLEAARCQLRGRDRVDAAAAIVRGAAQALVWTDEGGSMMALDDALKERVASPVLQTARLGEGPGLVPCLPYRGTLAEGAAIAQLAAEMASRHVLTPATRTALDWVAGRERLDLRGHRFVVMGGGAELAPTEVLLRAGATVLMLDLTPAQAWLAQHMPACGTLVSVPGGLDLLRAPREALAAIGEFAQGQPVHLGAFGYAGGRNREWRLAGTMNAIIRALDPALVRSVGVYVSPSSPAQACDEDAAESLQRLARPTLGERAWRAVGVLRPNLLHADGSFWTRSVVPMQGASYLASQYIEKRLAAEVYATRGLGEGVGFGPDAIQGAGAGARHEAGAGVGHDAMPGGGRPLVSAQVAGITHTASMDLAVFRACFAGGPSLGLESYEPQTTRWLSALVYLEHLLNPDSSSRAGMSSVHERRRAQAVHAAQVNGGLYAYPYAMTGTLVRSVVAGLRARPGLLPSVVAGMFGRRR